MSQRGKGTPPSRKSRFCASIWKTGPLPARSPSATESILPTSFAGRNNFSRAVSRFSHAPTGAQQHRRNGNKSSSLTNSRKRKKSSRNSPWKIWNYEKLFSGDLTRLLPSRDIRHEIVERFDILKERTNVPLRKMLKALEPPPSKFYQSKTPLYTSQLPQPENCQKLPAESPVNGIHCRVRQTRPPRPTVTMPTKRRVDTWYPEPLAQFTSLGKVGTCCISPKSWRQRLLGATTTIAHLHPAGLSPEAKRVLV